jgi:hypothetical protein
MSRLDVLADHDRVEPGSFGLYGEPHQVADVGGGLHGPVLGQDQDDPRLRHEETRTGSVLRPLVKFDRIRRGSPANSNRAPRRGQDQEEVVQVGLTEPAAVHLGAQQPGQQVIPAAAV